MEPNIKLARDGHFLSTTVASALRSSEDCIDMVQNTSNRFRFYKYLNKFFDVLSKKNYFWWNIFSLPFLDQDKKNSKNAGSIIKRPEFADFLEILANSTDPIEEFYRGEIARNLGDEFIFNGLVKYEIFNNIDFLTI